MNVPVEPDGRPRHRRRPVGPGQAPRAAGRARRARRDLELPPDQQPLQRLRPHPRPGRRPPMTGAGTLRRVLVANRGEIACRIIRSVHGLGLEAVAVHSDADRGAAHVRQADQAVRLGPAPADESYLRADRVIAARARAGPTRPPGLRLPVGAGRLRPARSRPPGWPSSDPTPSSSRTSGQARRPAPGPAPGCRCCRGPSRSDASTRPGQRPAHRLPGDAQEQRRGRRHRHAACADAAELASAFEQVTRLARPTSARRSCSWSGSCPGPGTSRCRSSATGAAASSCSATATARCSGATRRWSRRRRRPDLPPETRAALAADARALAASVPLPLGRHRRVRGRRRHRPPPLPRGQHPPPGRARRPPSSSTTSTSSPPCSASPRRPHRPPPPRPGRHRRGRAGGACGGGAGLRGDAVRDCQPSAGC
jgi:hypothetical protein